MTNKADSSESYPSLLEPQSRGGDEARRGGTFQTNVLISMIPEWLSQEGFAVLTQESMGDIEAKFYVPRVGERIVLLECKDNQVTPTAFWAEMKRFHDLHSGSPGTFRRFLLVCSGLSEDVKPIVNALRRLRGPRNMYPADSNISVNSYTDFCELVQKRNQSVQMAQFICDMVDIDYAFPIVQDNGQALFQQAMSKYLPRYNLRTQTSIDVVNNLVGFLEQRINTTITRNELEQRLREKIPESDLPPIDPVIIYTAMKEGDADSSAVCLDWADFFGGVERTYPPPEEWNSRLMVQLKETRDWIGTYRSARKIRLIGNRRLSCSAAIGFVFSAVAGYSIEMDYREEIWATDRHAEPDTPRYPLDVTVRSGSGNELLVSVGIIHEIGEEIDQYAVQAGLGESPALHIHGASAITSPGQANSIATQIKTTICEFAAQHCARRVHLFLATPAYLALFLGHRLNPLSGVQCYERVSPGLYTPTCMLA